MLFIAKIISSFTGFLVLATGVVGSAYKVDLMPKTSDTTQEINTEVIEILNEKDFEKIYLSQKNNLHLETIKQDISSLEMQIKHLEDEITKNTEKKNSAETVINVEETLIKKETPLFAKYRKAFETKKFDLKIYNNEKNLFYERIVMLSKHISKADTTAELKKTLREAIKRNKVNLEMQIQQINFEKKELKKTKKEKKQSELKILHSNKRKEIKEGEKEILSSIIAASNKKLFILKNDLAIKQKLLEKI